MTLLKINHKEINSKKFFSEKLFLLIGVGHLLWGAYIDFYNIALGTGNWYFAFSQKWFLALFGFVFLSLGLFIAIAALLWQSTKIMPYIVLVIEQRQKLGALSWVGVIFFVALPIVVFQFTAIGLVVSGIALRMLLVSICAFIVAAILTRSPSDLMTWNSSLLSIFIFSFVIVLVAQFTDVTNYPFSLEWSEGNRLWDYSILFGRSRYNYPADAPLSPFLDFGRQLTGGLAFLLPNLTIRGARLWVDLINVLPYLLFGLIIFYPPAEKKSFIWLAMGAWVFMYLRQVSIHTPLVISAILLVFVWRKPLWAALPVILLAAYFAAISRYTWTFAIGIWAVMLEFGSDPLTTGKIETRTWIRSITMGSAGLIGGFVFPKIIPNAFVWASGVSAERVISHLNSQPLLWYRLLPNATYTDGILLGVIKVSLPLIIILAYLAYSKKWCLNSLQKLSIVLPLFAFLGVGLIASTKIGGGGDLHNLDMFFIALVITVAIAWFNGGRQLVEYIDDTPLVIRILLIVIVVMPMLQFLNTLRINSYSGNVDRILSLTDLSNSRQLNLLPSHSEVNESLAIIRRRVSDASQQGEVLFIDQRQLLTFGFVDNVPLVPEYEKKIVIDSAMSQRFDYFEVFYRDIANHRFSLIVSNPLGVGDQNSDSQFGEENNFWVEWVARPILCYYERSETMPTIRVQLLTPRPGFQDCSAKLPFEIKP